MVFNLSVSPSGDISGYRLQPHPDRASQSLPSTIGWLTGTQPPIDWRTACVARLKGQETSCADDFSTFLSGIARSANAMAASHSCRTDRPSSRHIVATAAQAVHARAVTAPTEIAH